MQARRCVSALRCRQLPASIASARDEAICRLPEPVKRAILASKSPEIWRMSGQLTWLPNSASGLADMAEVTARVTEFHCVPP
jgi:hypothetical protein